MYKLRISSQAETEIRKIPRAHQEAILEAMLELKENPLIGKPLTRELTGRFSLRVGVYRIIYKVRKKEKTVEIITAGHRAKIYD